MKIRGLKERDAILETVLFYVAQDPTLNKSLILQGGGALHFIYSSPRYSLDLDFVAPAFKDKKDALIKRLSTDIASNGKLLFSSLKLSKGFLRVKYHYLNEKSIIGSVEIAEKEANDVKKVEGKFSPILVETPTEIYADKIIGTLGRMYERSSLKGTDLFDLEFITNHLNGRAEQPQIEQKAMDYTFNGYTTSNRDRVLFYIDNGNNRTQIIRDLSKTMSPDYFDTQVFDKEFFEKCKSHFERLKL